MSRLPSPPAILLSRGISLLAGGGRGASRVFLALLVAIILISPANSQDEPVTKKLQTTVAFDGPEIFARILDHVGIAPIESVKELAKIPADNSIVIVFGDPEPLLQIEEKMDGGLGGFLERGGAVLIACDRNFSFKKLPSLGLPELLIAQDSLANMNELQNFRGNQHCPIIQRSDFAEPKHPLFHDVKMPIATNRPGRLKPYKTGLTTLAKLPPGTHPDWQRHFGKLTAFFGSGTDPYIVASEDPRLLIVAGHGVFMNCMTVRKDLDNRRLALNAIQWLHDGKRTRALLLNEGHPITTFKTLLSAPVTPPVPSVEAVNRMIDIVQNHGLLQKALERLIDPANNGQNAPERIAQVMLIVATFGLLAYGLKKYFDGRTTLEAAPAVIAAPPGKDSSVVKRQLRELAGRDLMGEPAQTLARDWFESYAGISSKSGQTPDLSFEIHAGVFKRRRISQQIESLWHLASDPVASGWNEKRLRGLVRLLEELTLSVVAGEVVFDKVVGTLRVP